MRRAAYWIGVAAASVAAAWLRVSGAAGQVLVNDELHLVYAIVKLPLAEIARTWVFERADYSVPLALGFRALLDQGVRLSELDLRLPMLVSGVALVALAPCALRARLGDRAAVALAWLLATSPLLVYYSRLVRSYMPLTLVAGAAVWAGLRWAERRRWRFGVPYVLLSAAAIYLHLVAAPFVLAPVLLWIDELIASRSRSHAARDAALLLALAALVAALLYPARESIEWVVQSRREVPAQLAAGVGGALSLLAGRPPAAFAWLFYALLARGFWTGVRSEPRFHAGLLTVAAAHVAAVFVLSPERIGEATVFARYCIVIVPIALVWVALGLAAPWPLASPRVAAALALGVAALFVFGTLGQSILVRGGHRMPSFGNWSFFVPRDAPSPVSDLAPPPFYAQLGRERPAGVLLEAPWHHLIFTRMLATYQRSHDQEVLVSYLRGYPVNDPRLRLATVVRPDPTLYLRSRARYLVLHRDPGREERRLDPSGALPFAAGNPENVERAVAVHASWARETCDYLTREWGAPTYADEWLCVFDLDAARASGAGLVPAVPR
jgi:hypothetical protein